MSKRDCLFEIADSQQGYFTSQQAVKSGYQPANFNYYIASGEWIREYRGIYRLARYPISSDPHLVLWSLWSHNLRGKVQGVWSHETALEIYELSDVMPAKMHMTVPKKFRKRAQIPKNLVLHFNDLLETEMIAQQGYWVTTPLRTIIDVVEEGKISEDLIIQAIRDALHKGLISRHEINKATGCCCK
jgi:predicted transcriptional regulator of viral defense system